MPQGKRKRRNRPQGKTGSKSVKRRLQAPTGVTKAEFWVINGCHCGGYLIYRRYVSGCVCQCYSCRASEDITTDEFIEAFNKHPWR
jgi:hypothetical protein